MDYKEIVDNLDTESVINLMIKLGVDRYEDKETHIIFPTICHNVDASEASMKLYFYKDTKLFVCYTSCETLSIFKLLKNYYETRQIEYDWYEDIFLVAKNCSTFQAKEGFAPRPYQSLRERYSIAKKERQLEEYNKGVLGCFTKAYPAEWLQDGIDKQAMDKYNILYSISQNKIIIPHYDIDGRLIGIRGRALNEWEVENVGKYMPIQIENRWYKHPLHQIPFYPLD